MGDGPAQEPAGGVVERCVAGKGAKSCAQMKALLPVLALLCLIILPRGLGWTMSAPRVSFPSPDITSGLDSGDHSFGCTF